jgi:hypothetical protein
MLVFLIENKEKRGFLCWIRVFLFPVCCDQQAAGLETKQRLELIDQVQAFP